MVERGSGTAIAAARATRRALSYGHGNHGEAASGAREKSTQEDSRGKGKKKTSKPKRQRGRTGEWPMRSRRKPIAQNFRIPRERSTPVEAAAIRISPSFAERSGAVRSSSAAKRGTTLSTGSGPPRPCLRCVAHAPGPHRRLALVGPEPLQFISDGYGRKQIKR